jgi:chemotaxis protein MotB
MARTQHLFALAAISFMLTGCVAQEKYNALKLERDALSVQLAQAQTDASAARAQADAYKAQLDAVMASGGTSTALVANLTQQNAALQAQLDELNRKYNEAIGKIGSQTALPAELTNVLSDFARQNPDLVEFDPVRGIVKFKSDVTFAVGSSELNPRAREVIQRFSTILNSAGAANYELMVAGHTDNAPVRNQATISAGHKDNWYLSAHRAIAVSSELQHHNVNAQRIGVVGYADQRPVASNSNEAGKAQNRRVEVLILPRTVRASAPAPAAGTGSGTPAPRPAQNKDTGTVTPPPPQPDMSK